MNSKYLAKIVEEHNESFWNPSEGKTECPDANTCEVLNEFLDSDLGKAFSYSLSFQENRLSLSIETSNMDTLENLRLNIRLVEFLREELKLVKNSM